MAQKEQLDKPQGRHGVLYSTACDRRPPASLPSWTVPYTRKCLLRRRFQEGNIDVAGAAREVCDVVDEFGLRPPSGLTVEEAPLISDDLGVVCYQVDLPPKN